MGIRDFQLFIEKCPDGCSAFTKGETAENVFYNSWGDLNALFIKAEG